MSEILKHGKNYATVDCPRCEATVGYTGVDVVSYASQEEYNGETLYFEKGFITCPECGAPIVLGGGVKKVEKEDNKE